VRHVRAIYVAYLIVILAGIGYAVVLGFLGR
jgi:hypothetical protein